VGCPPAFIGDDGRIELSYSINSFVGDQPIILREMKGSDKGEVSLKEVKDTVLPGSEIKSGAGREQVGNYSFSTLQGSKTSLG